MKRAIFFLSLVMFLFTSSCGTVEEEKESKPLVVCTTNIIEDALNVLLKDDVRLVSLMGPGVDPHLYKASQMDLEHLQNADLIVSNGLHLEGKMADVLHKLSRLKTVVFMSDGVNRENLIEVSDDLYDPHIWFDINLWDKAIEHLALKLTEEFPELKDSISNRASAYHIELINLNEKVLSSVTQVPVDQRVLITAHDAFSYFGRAYEVEVLGLQGISTQSEYGLQDISKLVSFIVDREIKAIFVETSVNEKPLFAVLEGVEKRGHKVVIGGSLYSDALGDQNEAGNNYLNMVNHNVSTIVNALK